MFLEAVLLGFVVAWVRGGRPKENLGIRGMWLAPAAFGLQLVNRFLPPSVHLYITVVSYLLLLYLAWLNLENQGVRFILIGMILNVMVILANGGRIPVDLETARQVGVDVEALVNQVQAKHAPLTMDSRLAFLGDVIPVKYPFARIISVGDIFALIGAFLLIQDLMGKSIKIWRSEEARN